MTHKLLEDLKQSLLPYLFYWEEWSKDDNCNLSRDEIALVNAYMACSFEIGMVDRMLFYNKARAVKEVMRKLELGYQVFKDFVIVKFLFNIISMAKQYGYEKFLETPVLQLDIPENLRNILLSFKAYTLQQLFIIYKVEDFGRAQVFKKIVEFQVYLKEELAVNQS